MRKPIILLLVACSLASCSQYKIKKQLEKLTRTEIVIPAGMRQSVMGRDSVLLNPAVGAARMIVYIDSVDCSSCRLNSINDYAEIIDYHKEETGGEFVPVFIFSPQREKVGEVVTSLKRSAFNYPIFLDEEQKFSVANPHIPVDPRYHTFLLDKHGKVVLVGDPAYSPDLWELYKTTIATLIENGGNAASPCK